MHTRSWAATLAVVALCLAFASPAVAKDPVREFAGQAFGSDTPSAATGTCAGYWQTDTIRGLGQCLHLGRATFSMTHCTNVDFATGTGAFELGVMRVTAANGDQLFMTEHGTFQATPDPPVSHATSWWTITGGTGRFEGATGSGTGGGVLDIATGTGSLWFSGTISY